MLQRTIRGPLGNPHHTHRLQGLGHVACSGLPAIAAATERDRVRVTDRDPQRKIRRQEIKLSKDQRAILLHLYRLHLEAQPRIGLAPWGVTWKTSGTRSEQASISRSLRRLEARGLILRQNSRSGNNATAYPAPNGAMSFGRARQAGDGRRARSRTTDVLLLHEGVEVAERLTNIATENVNRLVDAA
jgi:hypothetical protein